METASRSEKKCPYCGEWTQWSQLDGDRCTHCGFDLMAQQRVEAQERKERFYEKKASVFTIKGDEHPLLALFYRTVNFIYMLFVGFMAAMVWLITTVAG